VLPGSIPDFRSLEGLITHSFAGNNWTNASSAGASLRGYSVHAQAIFIPRCGKAGILAVIGGSAPVSDKYNEGTTLVDMTVITVYDVGNQQWYHQNARIASGTTLPPAREYFCMVGASAADNSSYEM
jgi:hypothetical protein